MPVDGCSLHYGGICHCLALQCCSCLFRLLCCQLLLIARPERGILEVLDSSSCCRTEKARVQTGFCAAQCYAVRTLTSIANFPSSSRLGTVQSLYSHFTHLDILNDGFACVQYFTEADCLNSPNLCPAATVTEGTVLKLD